MNYYNLLQNWQKPFNVEVYRNINLFCHVSVLFRSLPVLIIAYSFCHRVPNRSRNLPSHIPEAIVIAEM